MALPSVTIGGNTAQMNPGIQYGSIVMPQTTYAAQPTTLAAAPMTTYAAAPTYTTPTMVAPEMSYAAPTYATTTYASAPAYTTTAVDVNRDGRADYVVAGTDFNRDGVVDAVQAPIMTSYAAPPTTYTQGAPTYMTQTPSYTALPTTGSMIAVPQQQYVYQGGPPQAVLPPSPVPAATMGVTQGTHQISLETAEPPKAKPAPKAAKKKKSGSCGCCGPSKKKSSPKKK